MRRLVWLLGLRLRLLLLLLLAGCMLGEHARDRIQRIRSDRRGGADVGTLVDHCEECGRVGRGRWESNGPADERGKTSRGREASAERAGRVECKERRVDGGSAAGESGDRRGGLRDRGGGLGLGPREHGGRKWSRAQGVG